MGRRIGARFLAIAIIIWASSVACQDPSSWALRGEIRFLGLRERIDAQNEKAATLDYSISNLGKSRIVGSVFAFSFSTDRDVYRGTVVDENPIASGALVYGRISVAYASVEESGELAGAVVDSAQFN